VDVATECKEEVVRMHTREKGNFSTNNHPMRRDISLFSNNFEKCVKSSQRDIQT
jgi:hypothetical protein